MAPSIYKSLLLFAFIWKTWAYSANLPGISSIKLFEKSILQSSKQSHHDSPNQSSENQQISSGKTFNPHPWIFKFPVYFAFASAEVMLTPSSTGFENPDF